MDEWSEGGLGQQRDDGGGRATMRYEGVESLGAYVDNLVINAAIFAWPCILSDRLPELWSIITWRGVECRYIVLLG